MIWFFGGSFVADYETTEWTWVKLLGSKLGDTIQNTGVGGSSLDHMYYQFDIVADQFEKNDRIVLTLTNIDRRYFVFEHPSISNPFSLDMSIIGPRGAKTLSDFYKWEFDNIRSFRVGIKNFFYRVQYLAKKLALDVIVINCIDDYRWLDVTMWPDMHFAQGHLHDDISLGEICNDLSINIYDNKYFKEDPRANHMCKSNHKLLADCVYEYYVNRIPIDIRYGFRKNIINAVTFHDKEFHRSQFVQPVRYKTYKTSYDPTSFNLILDEYIRSTLRKNK